MTNLIKQLTEATQSLKTIYLQKTKEYAEREFARMEEMVKWREVDWCKHFGLEPQPVNVGTGSEFLSFPKNFYNTKQSRAYYRLRDGARSAVHGGLVKHLAKAEKGAIMHYENSIAKLADRIIRKGLNQDTIVVTDSSIGVNINTTITDGTKTVRAYTIVAEGPIIAPHYRYLIS
jgi:hypothetical protein